MTKVRLKKTSISLCISIYFQWIYFLTCMIWVPATFPLESSPTLLDRACCSASSISSNVSGKFPKIGKWPEIKVNGHDNSVIIGKILIQFDIQCILRFVPKTRFIPSFFGHENVTNRELKGFQKKNFLISEIPDFTKFFSIFYSSLLVFKIN